MPVAVEKLTSPKSAEIRSRQDALQTIFSGRLDISYPPKSGLISEISSFSTATPVIANWPQYNSEQQMGKYSLETGEYVWRLMCECCGTEKNRVWGFISKHGDAHAVYYALLNVGEERPRVGLTLSVGPWWDGTAPSQRSWVHLNVRLEDDGIHMNIRDPMESNFYPWEKGGTPLNREQANQSSEIEEIWSVAEFIVATDLAVSSYLDGKQVNLEGRELRAADGPAHRC